MTGISSMPVTTYTSPSKVVQFVRYYSVIPQALDPTSGNPIGSETVGTGNATLKNFALANQCIVPGSDHIYIGTTESTVYTIDEDQGIITFAAAPASGTITACYWYMDSLMHPSTLTDFILRSEDQIDRRVGRTFKPYQTATDFYDGDSKDYTNLFTYQAGSFSDGIKLYEPDLNSEYQEKFLKLINYPVVTVNLIAVNEYADQSQEETGLDSSASFGLTTWLAQGFLAGQSNPLTRVAFKVKYSTGIPAAFTVQLRSDNSGVPSSTVLATASVATLTTSDTDWRWVEAVFTTPYTLQAGSIYHLIISSAGASAVNTYLLGIDATTPVYTSGYLSTSTNSGTAWTEDTSKGAIFHTYVASNIVNYDNYRLDKNTGRITFTQDIDISDDQGGFVFTKGVQNIVVNYTWGYASVPKTVEDIATKMAAIQFITNALLGSPTPISVPTGYIGGLRKEVEEAFQNLGEKIELLKV